MKYTPDNVQFPKNLRKVTEITERYFRKHGEIKPTTVIFTNDGFYVEEQEVEQDGQTFHIANNLVAAAADGATAVAFVAETWTSEKDNMSPSRDPEREEGIVATYDELTESYTGVCKINRQRFGAPRLSKWNYSTGQSKRREAGRLECIYERAKVRRNTVLVCDAYEPQLMLLMKPDGTCLRNALDEALVVSSFLMARESIERWSDGGEFHCVLAKDHLDALVACGGFRLTSARQSFLAGPDRIDDLRECFECFDRDMESLRRGSM